MFQLYMEVTGEKEWNSKEIHSNLATPKIIDGLRRVLGIEALTQLRSDLIGGASKLS